ncbi:unnamed protein product, partial [Iphiclides podalirius]
MRTARGRHKVAHFVPHRDPERNDKTPSQSGPKIYNAHPQGSMPRTHRFGGSESCFVAVCRGDLSPAVDSNKLKS